MTLTPKQIERYARHLPLFGQAGQTRLLQAKVLCVGAGGLGSAILQYLAAAGVGIIGIIDGDNVEISNLQRQVIFNEEDVGKNKAVQAAFHLKTFNSALNVITYAEYITTHNAIAIAKDFDLIIDGTDNYRTRYLLNDIAVKLKKPLISASIYQFQGQCSVFNYQAGPCYRCLYEEPPPAELIPNCALGGVVGVLPGLLGCIQATEAIKIILNQGNTLSGRLLIVDAFSMTTREFQVNKNRHCPCCQYGLTADRLFNEKNNNSLAIEIDVHQLVQKIHSSDVLLIDVREVYEREICHIGGLHIPLAQLEDQLNNLPKEKHIICYCKVGGRSRSAAQLLVNYGFKRVNSLQGGILAWINQIDSDLIRY
jgi:molybdopterin/thiamine biosynthesis adenylyltransferase/rhodanese-related sulfurtransferase